MIDIDKVRKKLSKLKIDKSPGPDTISPRILKELCDVLALPIYIIFKTSLTSCEIPKDWKTANITALFKKGDKKYAGNYRPVSLTCILCKLLENIVRENMIEHMQKYKLFSDKQYGFISGRSTVLQLLVVLDEWTEMLDAGGSIDVAYCDFMKAFDKVSHSRLLHKLKVYQFGDSYINWIKCFLNGRTQRVIINGEPSQWKPVTSGIPQGSVLGPMLFVLFINDLPEVLPNRSDLYLYADDTKIYRNIKTDHDRDLLQEDIYSMHQWSEKWLLKFHPDKCKTMTIGKTNLEERQYKLKDSYDYMDKSAAEKDVGVIVDDKLSFVKHIAEKVNKANSICGAIRRSFEYLDCNTFKQLFTALVRPHVEYANTVWSPYKKKDINMLENVQRRATKLVPGLSNMSYKERLIELKLPSLSYRRLRGDMIETFKILNDKYDFDPTTLFKLRKDSVTRGNDQKLYKQRSRLNIRKYSFTNRVVDVWNSLPNSVIQAKTVYSFECRLDKYWKEQDIMYDFEAQLVQSETNTGHDNYENEELVLEADEVGLLPEEDYV